MSLSFGFLVRCWHMHDGTINYMFSLLRYMTHYKRTAYALNIIINKNTRFIKVRNEINKYFQD